MYYTEEMRRAVTVVDDQLEALGTILALLGNLHCLLQYTAPPCKY